MSDNIHNTLFVFLGNDDKKYYNTRHNIAHMLFLHYAQINNIMIEENNLGYYFSIDSNIWFFAKSLMNICGPTIYKFFKKTRCEQIIAIHDDLETPFQKIKIKYGGSENGHNGLRSISQMFTKNYTRIKLGIGRPLDENVSEFVLKKFTHADHEIILSDKYFNSFFDTIEKITPEKLHK